jgi:hypothetical protein
MSWASSGALRNYIPAVPVGLIVGLRRLAFSFFNYYRQAICQSAFTTFLLAYASGTPSRKV